MLFEEPDNGSHALSLAESGRRGTYRPEEDRLLQELRRSEEGSDERLVQHYGNLILTAAWRLLRHEQEALDLSQKVFLEAFHSIHEHRETG